MAKALIKHISILFYFIFIVHSTGRSQQSVEKEVIVAKIKETREIIQSISSSDSIVIERRNDLRLLLNDIIIRLNSYKGTFPPAYLTAMDEINISSVKIASLPSDKQIRILVAIFKDLHLKFKDRANTLGSRIFVGLIPVTVICKRTSGAANNLRVRYAPLGYAVNTNKPNGNFARLTSPAHDKLIPGYYTIWVTEDGNFTVLQSWSGEISPEKENIIQLYLP